MPNSRNPILDLSIADAMEFLSHAKEMKPLEIHGIQVSASDLSRLLAALPKEAAKTVTVEQALAAVGEQLYMNEAKEAGAAPAPKPET